MIDAIDLFAGVGGFTEGAEQAGINVRWAANHWPLAIEYHQNNHPNVKHCCQDLSQADWALTPKTKLLLASPCCQGHSDARGKDSPDHDKSRSTAWAVVSCAEYHRPMAFVVENVPEFLKWALYPVWADAMHRLGYTLTTQIIDAADVGVAQNRTRMFIVGSRLRRPFEFQTPRDRKVKTARDIIDFKSGKWSDIYKSGRAEKTIQRAEAGRKQFGKRFVMPYYGSGSGLTGRSLDRPLGTVTTRDRWAVVDGSKMRMMTVQEYCLAMGFPPRYQLPATRHQAIHLLGNAVPPPLAKFVVRQVSDYLERN